MNGESQRQPVTLTTGTERRDSWAPTQSPDKPSSGARPLWVRALETVAWVILVVICWLFLAGCA